MDGYVFDGFLQKIFILYCFLISYIEILFNNQFVKRLDNIFKFGLLFYFVVLFIF